MDEHGLTRAGWIFAWSRGKQQLGVAEVRKRRDRATGKTHTRRTIRLSVYLVALNSEAEVRDTILHEIAHALAGVENGHNEKWKAVCRRIGAEPERLAGDDVVTVRPRYTMVCGTCNRTLMHRHRRIRPDHLRAYHCTYCGPTSRGTLWLHDAATMGGASIQPQRGAESKI